MEERERERAAASSSSSLFPLFGQNSSSSSTSNSTSQQQQWLCNSSFTADLSVVNDAVSTHFKSLISQPQDEEDENPQPLPNSAPVYQPLESDDDQDFEDRIDSKKKKTKKKKRKKQSSPDTSFRRSSNLHFKTSNPKPYFFDSKGDPDNLVFTSLYRWLLKNLNSFSFITEDY